MPSFDTVCDPDMVQVRNAVDNAAKEIGTRFDFKGTSAAIELKDKEITLLGDADFQLQQVEDILRAKLAKRGVDVRFLDKGQVQKAGGDKVRQVVKVRSGIATEDGKKIQKAESAGRHPGRSRARDGRQERRLASRHGPAAQGNERTAAVVQQLPRLRKTLCTHLPLSCLPPCLPPFRQRRKTFPCKA